MIRTRTCGVRSRKRRFISPVLCCLILALNLLFPVSAFVGEPEQKTVRVELPLELTAQENIRKHGLPETQANLSGLRVLLAEDNDLNAEIATLQLEEAGLRVERVSNGREAVDAFAGHPTGTYDVILMDIMMPVKDGYQAAREIRSLKGRADALLIPVIAMTANAFAEDVQDALDAGMNAHIAKPISMEEVLKTISGNLPK